MKVGSKNIVTIGGGTGSHAVLSGLKNLEGISLTALVSMADDGGSTGILRKRWKVMPPGDVRQCLVALSGKEFLNHIFKYGFLKGHKLGNIFLAILQKITGNFSRALKFASFVLNIKGKIIPITLDDAELVVKLNTGEIIEGESNIAGRKLAILDVDKISYKNKVTLNPVAKDAILKADYVVICPGGFHTSIVPNFIVEGFKEALSESKAKIIAIENLSNQVEKDYLEKLEMYLGKSVDIFVKKDKSLTSLENIVQNPNDKIQRSVLRHDPEKLSIYIKKIINI